MSKKVFIGVGHGGSDPGAVVDGHKEKDLNLSISLACRDELERHGVTVLMSRTEDDSETLTEKIGECNAFIQDSAQGVALDIHCNAGGGNGAEVYYHVGGGASKTLAENVLEEIVVIGQNSRGIKTKVNSQGKDAFIFIRNTNAPAVLVECAFMDTDDIKIIDTAAEQKAMGVAIAKGVLRTLGVPYKAEETKVEQNTPSVLYRVQVGAYAVRANAEAMKKKLNAAGYDAFIVEVKK